jgi:hypothetical protein
MATQNANGVAVTGGAVDGTTVGATTPSTGAFTTLSASGLISPSSTVGVKGTVTNDNANAGSVGEYISASASSFAMINNTNQNVTSISLTAGDWDVDGGVAFYGSAANMTIAGFGSNSVSATFGATGTSAQYAGSAIYTFGTAFPKRRYSLSATTTIYLVGYASFSSGTVSAYAYLQARRIR